MFFPIPENEIHMKYPFVVILLFFCLSVLAQNGEKVFDTFKDRRIINTHSVETLQKRQGDIRIGHRFGDFGGPAGGWESFFGIENAADILIGLEYGATDNLTLGLFRTKGAGPLKQLLNGQLKYKLLAQRTGEGSPVTITVLGFAAWSTMKKSDNPEAINFFPKDVHRLVSGGQLLIARKFSSHFSLQITPGFLHRNIVPHRDENNLYSLGIATRIQFTKVLGLIADITFPFSDYRNEYDFEPPFGIGFELDTGGHVFQVNFTNVRGMSEADYIPYSNARWGDGEFRLGFTISRTFNL